MRALVIALFLITPCFAIRESSRAQHLPIFQLQQAPEFEPSIQMKLGISAVVGSMLYTLYYSSTNFPAPASSLYCAASFLLILKQPHFFEEYSFLIGNGIYSSGKCISSFLKDLHEQDPLYSPADFNENDIMEINTPI
jgi:hypothetical protein